MTLRAPPEDEQALPYADDQHAEGRAEVEPARVDREQGEDAHQQAARAVPAARDGQAADGVRDRQRDGRDDQVVRAYP
ncbi:hypothetical protein CCS38_06970, partial [Streptomyces purpurogeneiscleroticus]|nr:hypothetical protein [Streptomyces purpurogeneiscleroticus]